MPEVRRYDVVVVNDRAFSGGGASKVAMQSAIGLARRGHRVTVFAAMGPAESELRAAGVTVHVLGQSDLASGRRGRLAIQGLWNREAAARLTALLRSKARGRTVVHIHSWSKALSASVFAAAGRFVHPVVATMHDYGFACPNAALHDFPAGTACRRTPMSLACLTHNCDARHYAHKLWRVARQGALQRMAGADDVLACAVCVSDYSHRILRPLVPEHVPMSVVANPIDVVDAGPASPARSSTFTYVGRFSREKGVLLAAEAAKQAGVPLTLVGDGELRDEVMRIHPQATVTGWLAAEGVRAALRASRCVVFPSIWRETQGMVLPEAFGSGVPVIASSGTAPASAIAPDVNGVIFPNGDVAALAATLRRLAGDDAAIAAMGKAAYDGYWAAPATLDRHLDALEAVYRRALRHVWVPARPPTPTDVLAPQ